MQLCPMTPKTADQLRDQFFRNFINRVLAETISNSSSKSTPQLTTGLQLTTGPQLSTAPTGNFV